MLVICLLFLVFFWQIGLLGDMTKESVGAEKPQSSSIPNTTKYSAKTIEMSDPSSLPFNRGSNEAPPYLTNSQGRNEIRDRIISSLKTPEKCRSGFFAIKQAFPLGITQYPLRDKYPKLARRLIFPLSHTSDNSIEPPLILI